MKTRLMFIVSLLCAVFAKWSNPEIITQLINKEALIQIPETETCDTICGIKGYDVHIRKDQGEISHIGLNLFTDEMKRSTDKSLLDFVEEALLAKVLNVNNEVYDRLVINKGRLSDFSSLSPQLDCYLTNNNSNSLTIEWPLGEGCVSVTMPLNYDILSAGSRAEIENDFITKIKTFKGSRHSFEPIDTLKLEPYGENKYIYTGPSYHNMYITRNIYLNSDNISPVYEIQSPVESIANIFVYPSEISDSIQVDLTILKHEYGEKESFSISLNKFLAACEDDGCTTYWGIEKYENDVLEGSLFLYNKYRGYDHVIKVECNPRAVLNKQGRIQARASIFIPTNNVQNLNSPYIKKNENEKIRYDK